MQRRTFLQLSAMVPVTAFVLPAGVSLPAAANPAGLPAQAVLVRKGQDRYNQPFRFLDAEFTVKVSGKDTGGRCVIFDTVRTSYAGPALHYHKDCEEWFAVEEGEFKFQAGKEILRLKAGDTLLVPRGVPHAFVKTSAGTARLLVMHQPAGTMEEYFRAGSTLTDQRIESRKALAARHDIHIIGPSLKPD
ncbi:cupin domain-containing protein [Hymenobacter koreensis]|uniref:Cupin domain-containing protein n=1 Tax=Hymenobacter koreensis TaxID=1084523 RepID=A0ABP8IYL5_9BACT